VKIAVIPCSKEKIWDGGAYTGAATAAIAYTSPLHRAARDYATRVADVTMILSAKYGLLHLHDLIEGPYDVTFSRSDDPVIEPDRLARQVQALRVASSLIIACPDDYAQRLLQALGDAHVVIERPLSGYSLADLQGMTAHLQTLP
tara:strand:+ start:195 stop:629 length:435 start_codon:yes stop_codon:yes gene_type:complete